MGILRMTFAFIIFGLLVVVCFQNVNQNVSVVKVFYENFTNQNLGLILLVTVAVGMVLAFLISLLSEIKLRRMIWIQRREIKKLNTEITALRNLPLAQVGEEASLRPQKPAQAEGRKDASP